MSNGREQLAANKVSRAILLCIPVLLLLMVLAGCGHVLKPGMPRRGRPQTGIASWYGSKYHGRTCANGEKFDMYKLTAAHKSLPFGTRVRVTNLENNKSVVVRINDRGPFVRGRIIDLSYAAAKKIGMLKSGIVKVRAEIVGS